MLKMSDIGYIPDIAYFIAQMPEKSDKNIICDSWSCMSQMSISINGRSADIKSDMARIYRCKKFLFSGK